MNKSLKIIVRLDWRKSLVLEPTQENMKLALLLSDLPLYTDEYKNDEIVYSKTTTETVDVNMRKVVVNDVFELLDQAAE